MTAPGAQRQPVQYKRKEDTDRASDEDNEERANTKTNVVIACAEATVDGRLFFASANTVSVIKTLAKRGSRKAFQTYSTPAWK